MKLKVKDMDISTGGVPIAILHIEDAKKFDLYPEDRITVRKGKKVATAVFCIMAHKATITAMLAQLSPITCLLMTPPIP